MFGCMPGQAPKSLTARWTLKDVYFRNAMRVKPSPRTECFGFVCLLSQGGDGDPRSNRRRAEEVSRCPALLSLVTSVHTGTSEREEREL